MTTCRLIYKSSAPARVDEQLIDAVARTAAAKNKRLGITGLLLATKTQFLQVLEGDRLKVNKVYQAILADPRHCDVVLIGYQEIATPMFRDWAMRGVGIGLLGRLMATQLKEKYGTDESGDLEIPLDPHKAFALLYDVAYLLRRREPA